MSCLGSLLRELWVNWELGQLSGRAPVKSGGQFGSSLCFFCALYLVSHLRNLVKGTLGQLGVGIAQ